MKKLNNKGFSLVELIIVIAIMAILVGVVGTQVIPYLENSRKAKDIQILSAWNTAGMSAYSASAAKIDATARYQIKIESDKTSLSDGAGKDGADLLLTNFCDLAGFEKKTATGTTGYNGYNWANMESKAGKAIKYVTVTVEADGVVAVDVEMDTSKDDGKKYSFDQIESK
jgi:prepilin-type N-terminal cleavage/methylation domain-containing protein